MTPLAVRWLKFNAVGALGIVVQMGAFALLFSALHLNYMVATALAVETAVLHNFVWHERYTWKHLPRGAPRDVAWRLLRFHAGNGAISILGNLALMRLFVGTSAHPSLRRQHPRDRAVFAAELRRQRVVRLSKVNTR